jgi:F-type H+-transporting ATPase subunit epsilon
MSLLQIEIISPQGIIFKGQCHLAVVPGVNGDMGVMFDHESFVTALKAGKIEIFDEKEVLVNSFEITGGFAETHEAKKLVVLVD